MYHHELEWNDRFNIGITEIDKAHQRLFSIIGKLVKTNEDMDAEKRRRLCHEGIKYFKSYALKHFAEEEAYMQSIHYKDFALHKQLHDNMRDKTLPSLEAELEEQNYSEESVQHFLGICTGWLSGHIMVEDYAITGRILSRWPFPLEDEELDSLEQAVIPTLQRIFRVETHIVSNHYGVEDFSHGNALCVRISYVSVEGATIHAFLIYENRMVLSTLSAMLRKPITRIDQTVISAMKVLSQKVMSCIGSYFPSSGDYMPQRNEVITFELLEKTFYQNYPPYSLLFDMGGNGYFALCIET